MPPLPPRPKQPVLRWARGFLLALGIASLGYVGYSLVDAKLFQAYENWQLERATKISRSWSAVPPSQVVHAALRSAGPPIPVAPGGALGRIEIPRIGVDAIVVEGTSGKSLRRAVGHIAGTALPGESGNVAIAGHRDTFFRDLRNIRQGDEITLTTMTGSYRYRVESAKVVDPENTEVLNASGESVLTLVTCYPYYFVGPAPQRFVVRAHGYRAGAE
jgi:sortase A